MGNCSGIKIDLKQNNDEQSNEIQTFNSILHKIQHNEHDNLHISQLIETIKKVEELNETLVTEPNEIIKGIQSISIEDLKTSVPIQQDNGLFSNKPSTKHTQINKIPQKQLNENIKSLEIADMRLQQLFSLQKKQQNKIILQEANLNSQAYYENGEIILNKVYRPIRVYSRMVREEEEKKSNQVYLEDQQYFYQKDKFNFNQDNTDTLLGDEQINETESDGNYEGSEEENVKLKEKLIDNLFSDRHWNKQLTVIDDADESAERSPIQKQSNAPHTPSSHSHKGGRSNVKNIQKKNSQKIKNYPTFTFSGGTFQGQVQDQKRNGIGQQTFLDGTVYMGEWKQDKRFGKGVQIWPDDTLYEGEWYNDFIQGIGKIEYSNRIYYIGEWKENKFHGKGRFQHFSGANYEGFWHQDLQHGKGVEVQLFPHYSRYEGIFEFGKKQGKGRLLMGNGSSYKGDFMNNNVHGLGVYNWANGVMYEGRWENNKMSGNGKMTWPHNIIYQGEFRNDQKSGIGFIEYEDGSKYIGEWKADKQDGKGTFYFKKNNSQIKGIWENGKIITITSYFVSKTNQYAINNLSNINNGNRNNTLFLPGIPHNMIKSVNSPMYSDFQMPENFNTQRSVVQDNQKLTAYKSERLKNPQEIGNSKYSNNYSPFRQAFSLKNINEKK